MLLACSPVEPQEPSEDETQSLHVAMDLTKEWDKVAPAGSLVQGCLVIRKEFAEQHPAEVAAFLAEYEASVNYLLNNIAEAADMIAAQGIFAKAPVAKKAIPNCNITYLDGADMKAAMSEFLNVMIKAAPASIGGAIPADDFYYEVGELPTTAAIDNDLPINVSVLSGTTGFGMAQMMQSAADGGSALNCQFTVEAAADKITGDLVKGTVDIAALPTNAAATLYNKTQGKVQLLAINTRGVLYLLDNGNGIKSFADLKGKTVYVPAQNPTFIFKYLCEQNGLTVGTEGDVDVIISNKFTAPAELQQNVAAGTVTLAVLPEPMVTIALTAAAQNQQQ
ncbi:MAG: ABC transporter substrate-binding protein, partial [Clostridia bacterium]|nr:ABC transporter substrate-binding protein [Clostridia bacterium]